MSVNLTQHFEASLRPTECPLCHQSHGDLLGHLWEHRGGQSLEANIKCPYPDCDVSFGNPREHFKTHYGDNLLACPHLKAWEPGHRLLCQFRTSVLRDLDVHRQSAHHYLRQTGQLMHPYVENADVDLEDAPLIFDNGSAVAGAQGAHDNQGEGPKRHDGGGEEGQERVQDVSAEPIHIRTLEHIDALVHNPDGLDLLRDIMADIPLAGAVPVLDEDFQDVVPRVMYEDEAILGAVPGPALAAVQDEVEADLPPMNEVQEVHLGLEDITEPGDIPNIEHGNFFDQVGPNGVDFMDLADIVVPFHAIPDEANLPTMGALQQIHPEPVDIPAMEHGNFFDQANPQAVNLPDIVEPFNVIPNEVNLPPMDEELHVYPLPVDVPGLADIPDIELGNNIHQVNPQNVNFADLLEPFEAMDYVPQLAQPDADIAAIMDQDAAPVFPAAPVPVHGDMYHIGEAAPFDPHALDPNNFPHEHPHLPGLYPAPPGYRLTEVTNHFPYRRLVGHISRYGAGVGWYDDPQYEETQTSLVSACKYTPL